MYIYRHMCIHTCIYTCIDIYIYIYTHAHDIVVYCYAKHPKYGLRLRCANYDMVNTCIDGFTTSEFASRNRTK